MNTTEQIIGKRNKVSKLIDMKIKSILIFLIVTILFSCYKEPKLSSSIQLKQFNFPVLKGKKSNPVLRICINNTDLEKTLEAIKINIKGTKAKNLSETRIYFSGTDSLFNDKIQFGKTIVDHSNAVVKGSQVLSEGNNYLWVSYRLSEIANLTEKLTVSLDYLDIDGQLLIPENVSDDKQLRMGVAVRDHWVDNVHTYRIPGLATSNKGTLLAVYDVRRGSGRDLQGHMDIGLSRSFDGGQNWEPMQIVLDMKTWGGLPEKFNGVSDASILVDKTSDAIFIAGLWMHGVINKEGQWLEGLNENSKNWNHQWRTKGSQPGLGVKQTSQFLIIKSTDDGKTWSEPINLTKMCKDPKWWLWAPAPGHGITLKDGTLVFPTQGRDKNGLPFSNITYSKDAGKTWKTSRAASHDTTESMAVELSDGSIMLNMRDNRNGHEKGDENGRSIFVTKDLGNTWTEHATSHGALIEPKCMASIHRHDYKDAQGKLKRVLLFSNPNSKYKRHKQTIKVSFDEGLTWPEKNWIELDVGRGAGYSCLTSIDVNTIGVLYEGSQAQMTFQKILLDELVNIE